MYFSILVIALKVQRQQIIKKRESINTSNLNCQLNFLVSNIRIMANTMAKGLEHLFWCARSWVQFHG